MDIDQKKLKLAMMEKGFNVASLARAAGMSPAAVNLYVNHGVKPRLDSLGKVVKALGVPVMEIVKEA